MQYATPQTAPQLLPEQIHTCHQATEVWTCPPEPVASPNRPVCLTMHTDVFTFPSPPLHGHPVVWLVKPAPSRMTVLP